MQKHTMFNKLLLTVFLILTLPLSGRAATGIPEDKSSAIILAYHRIGEDAYPDSNLRSAQFEAHIKLLSSEGYNVMALPDIVTALKGGEKLPPKTVAITFEGAYQSAYTNAMQLLLEKNLPFTVFFASDHAEGGVNQHMSWKELQNLSHNKQVSFGLLPASYTRLAGEPAETILAQINRARVHFRDRLKSEPTLFSYPFGEYSLAYKTLIADQGFDAAFGLQSGALSPVSDFYALPRFSMTEIYGDIERLQMITNALPLPVSDIEPADPYLYSAEPPLGFSVPPSLSAELSALSCYISGQEPPTVEILGDRRVELRPAHPLEDTKTRVNCTLPGPTQDEDTQSWRWFSMLLVKGESTAPSDSPPQE